MVVVIRTVTAILFLLFSQQVFSQDSCESFDYEVKENILQSLRDSDLKKIKLLITSLDSLCGTKMTFTQKMLRDVGWLFSSNHDFVSLPENAIETDALAENIALLPNPQRVVSFAVLAEHFILTGDFMSALAVSRKISEEDIKSLSNTDSTYIYINLSYIYIMVGFTGIAEDYAKSALEMAENPNNRLRALIAFLNTKDSLSERKKITSEIGQLVSQISANMVRSEGYAILFESALENGNYQKARDLLEKALADAKASYANRAYLGLLITKSELAIQNSNYEIADSLLSEIRRFDSEQLRVFTKARLLALEAELYEYQGDIEKALRLTKKEMSVHSLINQKINSAIIVDLITKYQLSEQQREIAALNQEKQNQEIENVQQQQLILIYTLSVIALILSLLLLFLLFWRKRKSASHFERLASYDTLTQSLNRRAIQHIAENEFNNASPLKNLVIAIADIDHFKNINDSFGHNVGDEVLKEFARRTKSIIRKSDYIGRWGGEEWLLLFPNTGLSDIEMFFSRLQAELSTLQIDKQKLNVTFSMGAVSATGYSNFTDALNAADNLLYEAKKSGRDKLIVQQGEM